MKTKEIMGEGILDTISSLFTNKKNLPSKSQQNLPSKSQQTSGSDELNSILTLDKEYTNYLPMIIVAMMSKLKEINNPEYIKIINNIRDTGNTGISNQEFREDKIRKK